MPGFEKNHRACKFLRFRPGECARCSRNNARVVDIDELCTYTEEAEGGETQTQQEGS